MNKEKTQEEIQEGKIEPLGFWLVVIRGIIGRCPHCGEGKLFSGYLKQVDNCSICNENIGSIRADDGPAWLTMIVVGHILAPLMLAIVPNSTLQDWLAMILWTSLALILAILFLPRAKGIFIGAIWRTK